MNKIILKFILLFKPLFERFDINTEQLAIILAVKLKMDDRRPAGFMAGRQTVGKKHNNSSLLTMAILFVMGCLLMFFLTLDNAMMGHAIYFTVFMVMVSLTLISDFTSVLIDVRDNYIILPRPVKDSTLAVSRILHISIHISKIVLALCLPALVGLIFFNGLIGGVVFIIEVISATVLTIFLVNMVYLLVLKVSSPQKFKDFISYFQIIFSVLIFASYQLLPRLLNNPGFKVLDILSYKLSYLLPPVWFASFFNVLLYPENFSWLKLILGLIGIIAPFVTLYIVIKFLAPGFNKKLSSISGSGSDATAVLPTNKQAVPKTNLVYQLSVLLGNDKLDQAGFRLTWWLTSRYRDFKIKVYPSFAYVPVYFVYFLYLRGNGPTVASYQAFSSGKGYIGLTYLTSFVILTVLQQVTQAEKFKSAWVMFSTPHNKPGRILSGMFKALIVKYFVPYYLLISIFSIYTWGFGVLNDMFFAFFNIVIFGLVTALFTVKHLPFSQPVNPNKQGGRVIINLLIMSFIGLLGFMHYGLSRWEWAIWILTLLSAGLCWALYQYFQNRNWQALEAEY